MLKKRRNRSNEKEGKSDEKKILEEYQKRD